MKLTFHCLLLLTLVSSIGCSSTPSSTISDEEPTPTVTPSEHAQWLHQQMESLIVPLLDGNFTVGVVVGVIDGSETSVVGYGTISADSDEVPDENTVFEIGSITKPFTSLLLATMVEEGLVSLDDPIDQFLPEGAVTPELDGVGITLANLATHTSGLPRMPGNLDAPDLNNPYVGYGEPEIIEFLSQYELEHSPGENWDYSNLGAGLLGHLLAQHQSSDYETLLTERVLSPLGLNDTAITLSSDQQARLAQGHGLTGRPVSHWDFDVLAPCGALRSTANDMLAFVQANLQPGESPLSSAITSAHVPRLPTPIGEWQSGLAWFVSSDGQIVWHDGGTGGFFAFVGFNQDEQVGIVWLSNSSLWRIPALEAQLQQLLLGEPVASLGLESAVQLPEESLSQLVGAYQFATGEILEVELDGGQLVLSAYGTEGGTLLFAQSEDEFSMLEAPGVFFIFDRDEDGNVIGMTVGVEGTSDRAVRLDELPTPE